MSPEALRKARKARDQQIALSYVKKGEARTAAAEIARETETHIRTVYRAIEQHLDWAREEAKRVAVEATSADEILTPSQTPAA